MSMTNTTSSSPARRPITMDEVWKDIALASDLQPNGTTSSPAVILQDFFSKDPSPAIVPTSASSSAPPPTLLTLNSGLNNLPPLVFPPPPSHQYPNPNPNPAPAVSIFNDDDNAPVGKKRFSDCGRNSGDRRQKRMIKNRESAARSRARKQAYTNELELEVAHLLEENTRLREQQLLLFRDAAAQDEKKKPSLHRTCTAPF